MGKKRFRANRIILDNMTFDLDQPIEDPVFYQTTRRMTTPKAVERLIKRGHIEARRELRRQKKKEDALIKALKDIGGILLLQP